MTKKKKTTAAVTAVVAAALLFAGSFAWVSTLQTATNKFRRSDYNVQLHDVFEGTEVVTNDSETGEYTSQTMEWTDEKDTLNKDIWVTNNGSGDILVRLKFTEEFHMNNHGTSVDETQKLMMQGINSTKQYDSRTGNIRNYIEWKIGEDEWSQSQNPKILTLDEWNAIMDPSEKVGAFWVMDTNSNLIWMEPLKASDPTAEAEPLATGNTALALDSVRLKDNAVGHVDYSIKVEMDAIDTDLVGFYEENSSWGNAGGSLITLSKAAANADKVKKLKAKRDTLSNNSVKMFYNEAINAALNGASDKEVAELEAKAQELQVKIETDDTYTQQVITHDETTGKYKLKDSGTEIDESIVQYIADQCGCSTIIDLTKADLAAVGSISTTNKNVSSFSGLTAEYFPNLTSITLLKETSITADDLNAMDTNLKKQLKRLSLIECGGLAGSIDVSGFENLAILDFRACKQIGEVTGLASSLRTLDLQQTKITTLDLTQCENLNDLNLWSCSSLERIIGSENLSKVITVNVKISNLTELNLQKADLLRALYVSNSVNLTDIVLSDKAFTYSEDGKGGALDIQGCTALTSLDISKMTLITQLNVTGCEALHVTKRKDQTLTPNTFTNFTDVGASE